MNKQKLSQEQTREYIRVANYYYKASFTQDEIAKKMNISRQKVNRIIRDCVDEGIVEIKIAALDNANIDIEMQLEKMYNLKAVRVIDNVIDRESHTELGVAAGEYLSEIIRNGDIIGFSRGRCTSALVDNMPLVNKNNLTVTQLLGSENRDHRHIKVDDIVYRFSEKLHASATMLYAPVIVQDKELKSSMMKEKYFGEAYKVIKSCDIAIVGIGLAKNQWKHISELYDDEEQLSTDVAGEVATHFFDKDGKAIDTPFRDRIISIALKDYLNIPTRIGVAGGSDKAHAIRAAIKGGYVNVLVTDLETAHFLRNNQE